VEPLAPADGGDYRTRAKRKFERCINAMGRCPLASHAEIGRFLGNILREDESRNDWHAASRRLRRLPGVALLCLKESATQRVDT
jgi:hypothetical protein